MDSLIQKLLAIRMKVSVPKRLGRILKKKLDDEIAKAEHDTALAERVTERVERMELISFIQQKTTNALKLKGMLRKGYLELAWPDALYVAWLKRKWIKTGRVPKVIRDFHLL